jgi:hypothetical protein
MSRGRVRSNEGGKSFVPDSGQGLGEVVRDVAEAFDVSHAELELSDPVLDPIEVHVTGLESFGVMVRLARPTATSLSQCIVVGGWG